MRIFFGDVDIAGSTGVKKLLFICFQHSFELIAMNIFFVICCLPVVTTPFAAAALCRVCIDFYEDMGSRPLRTYWKTFFSFNKRTFFVGFPIVILHLVLLWGLMIYLNTAISNILFWFSCGVNVVAMMLVIMIKNQVYPLLHRMQASTFRTWKVAFQLMVIRLPQGLVACAAVMILWALCIHFFQSAWIVFILIFFSFSHLLGVFCAMPAIHQYVDTAENTEKGERNVSIDDRG